MADAGCDIVIVGGGLVGSCAAALLARHGGIEPRRIVLLEPAPAVPLPQDAPFDLRVSALSPASANVLRAAGAWDALPAARLCAFERMHVWHDRIAPFGGGELVFDAADVALPGLGHIAENRVVQHALLQSFRDAGGRVLRARMGSLMLDADAVRLTLEPAAGHPADPDLPAGLVAKLVIGADGASSAVRTQAQIEVEDRDLHQRAIVATVATDKPHAHTAWQCFLPTGPLAFLPLADGHSSIVWSCVDERAHELLAMDAAGFTAALDAASALVLGSVTLASERASFPLRSLAAARYVAERCALLGDAAHVVHPLAGQGVNLGLMDAAALCEQVAAARATREDPGALRLLRRYERARKAQNALMAQMIQFFDSAFTTAPSASAAGAAGNALARRGLSLAARNATARRFFMRHALGFGGDLPCYAR